MTPEYYLCDVCGSRVEKTDRIFAPTAFGPDAAGGPSEETGEYLDLCSRHAGMALISLLHTSVSSRAYNHELGIRLVAWVQAEAKKGKKP